LRVVERVTRNTQSNNTMPPQENKDGGAAAPTAEASTLRRTSSESSMSGGEDGPIKTYRDYKVRKSSLIGMINWTHVLYVYLPVIFVVGLGVLLAQIVYQVVNDLSSSIGHQANLFDILNALKDLFLKLFERSLHLSHDETLLSSSAKITALVLVVMGVLLRMDNPVYLLSFATFHAPDSWKVSHEQIIEMMRRQNTYTDESLDFMRRLLVRSGTGQSTAWPPGIVQCLEGKETDKTIEGSRKEAEYVIFDIVEKALKKAKVHPKEIDVLVINCSLFSPTPSLCAMVVSKFGMRSDVLTYNLSGMGCAASLISVGLAKDMLQRHRGKALVVSTEIITPNLYYGNERGFLLQNTLFRCGGAAIVLSNKWSDGRRAWYKLLHTVRVQGTGEKDYQCVFETQDEEGHRGVRLSKDIVKVAGKCMEKNMTTIGPYVLPLSEQIKVVYSLMVRFFFKTLRKTLTSAGKEKWAVNLPHPKVFVPDFKRGIDHFCIHAGGRAVIDGIEKNMKLELFHSEPSRMALLNFGNTSSSSIWYELEYIQEKQTTNPLRKGHRVMQVAFGSGFKCTSGVWLKL